MIEIVYSDRCPMCQSDEVVESSAYYSFDREGEIRVDKQCGDCHSEWADKYEFSGLDFPDHIGDVPLFV